MKTVIEMARECHLHIGPGPLVPGLKKFYQAAYAAGAAAEREAAAKMVEDWDSDSADPRDIATAIRARGNT